MHALFCSYGQNEVQPVVGVKATWVSLRSVHLVNCGDMGLDPVHIAMLLWLLSQSWRVTRDLDTVRITAGALELDGKETAVNLMSYPRLLQAKRVLIEAADYVLDIPG